MKNLKKGLFTLILFTNILNAQEVYATFNVQASKNAHLAFNSSGIVNHIYVDVSSEIKKGDTLAKLHNNDHKAMVAISQTALKYAKRDYNRQVKVKHMIDKAKFDQYAYKHENAKNQLRYQQALLAKTTLKAPFDGIIYEKSVEIGDMVSGQMKTIVFKIQSKNARKLVLEFDQKYHKIIKIGDVFNYKLDGDTTPYQGKITKIYPYANNKTRKISAEVLCKDLMVGLFGDGYITSKN
ncbi:MAG: efflux RND transporter periplasmic adaptor subunit [Campylobacterota bacterium]|nr:efflux RND transporter periplasmic adaptor subunit [Campylobacterota bacterium]